MEPFERRLGFNFGPMFGQVGTQINKPDKSGTNKEKKSSVELFDGDGGEQTPKREQKYEDIAPEIIINRKRFNLPSGAGASGLPSVGSPQMGTGPMGMGKDGFQYIVPAGPWLPPKPPTDPTSGGVESKVRRRVGSPIQDVPVTDDPTIDRKTSGGGGGGTRQGGSDEPKKSTKFTDLGKEGGYIPVKGVGPNADKLKPKYKPCRKSETIRRPNPQPGPGQPDFIDDIVTWTEPCCSEEQQKKIQELFASIVNDPLIRERGQRFLWCITNNKNWTRTDNEKRTAWTELEIECVDEEFSSYDKGLDADQNRTLKLSPNDVNNLTKIDLLKLLLIICTSDKNTGKFKELDFYILTTKNLSSKFLTEYLLSLYPDAKKGWLVGTDYFQWDTETGIVYAIDYNGSRMYRLLKNLPWKK